MTRVLMLSLLLAPAIAGATPSPNAETSTAAALPDVCPPGDSVCVDAKRRELESVGAWQPSLGAQQDAQDLPSMGYAFFKMIVVLGAVCLLAYLSLGKLMPRLMRVQQPTAHRRILQVVDRLPLDPRRSIMIVKTGPETFHMVGISDQGINLLARLDPDEIGDALESTEAVEGPSLGRFAKALLAKKET